MSQLPHSLSQTNRSCFTRRKFLQVAGAGTAALVTAGVAAGEVPPLNSSLAVPETAVQQLYDSLSDDQKQAICFRWDHQDSRRGLLRTRVGANWHITEPTINSDFFTASQRGIIREVFEGIVQPDWRARFDKQLQDDTGGFGNDQNIAIFGKPGEATFEFVLTGRHMTLRCDGNSAEHMAFGGPVFYGHAASGATEKPTHPGNIFWEQALAANGVYKMLDGKQRKLAEVVSSPREQQVVFRGPTATKPGIPVTELSADQKRQVQKTLDKLIEPFRQTDRDEVVACLKAQGGLDKCCLAFYTDKDLGNDGVWDNWRLEGPSFVWYFRGSPHVHVWVHVADSPTVKLNS